MKAVTKVTDRIEAAQPRRFRPYPAYKDSGMEWLGEVPAHWAVYPLRRRLFREAGSIKIGPFGSALKLEFMVQEGFKVYGQEHAISRDFCRGSKYVDEPKFTELAACEIRPRDLVVTMMGSSGRCAVVPDDIETGIMDSHLLRIRLPDAELDPSFLALLIDQADYIRDQIQAAGKGAIMHGLNSSIVKSIVMAVPPTAEQLAILDFLDRETAKIDGLVAGKERLIELLQEKRAALITRAVTRGLDPLADTRAAGSPVFPVVPKDCNLWKMRRLIRQVRRPIVVRPDREYREIGIRSWGKGIFHKEPVRGALLGEKSVFRPEPGDFVLNIVFAWEGAVAVVSEHETGMIASHRFPTFRPSDHVDLDYLLMVLQSDQGRRLMEVNSPGAAGRNKTLRIGQFLDEELPLPSIEKQRAIVAAFRKEEGRLSTLAITIRQAIDHLKELRTALISAAVTGKIDVREATPL